MSGLFRVGLPPLIDESEGLYDGIGLMIVWVSTLEKRIQDFIFACLEKDRQKLLEAAKQTSMRRGQSTKNPRLPKPSQFADAICDIMIAFPILRTEPFWDTGGLDLNELCYRLEQTFDVRNHIAHGAVTLVSTEGPELTFEAEKWSRGSSTRHHIVQRYRFTQSLLTSTINDARILEKYFRKLMLALDGTDCWESMYKSETEMKQNSQIFKDLVCLGVLNGSPLFEAFDAICDRPL